MSSYREIIAIGSFVALLMPLTAGTAVEIDRVRSQPVTLHGGSVAASTHPIPVRGKRTPSSRSVWIPGYWHWDGRRHVWVPGRWSQPSHRGRNPFRYGHQPPRRFVEPPPWAVDPPRWRYQPVPHRRR